MAMIVIYIKKDIVNQLINIKRIDLILYWIFVKKKKKVLIYLV